MQSVQHNITFRIEQPDDNLPQYTAKVSCARGEAYHFFNLPENWTPDRLSHMLNDFRSGVAVGRYAAVRGEEDQAILTPKLFGKQLFDMVFSGKVHTLYRESLAEAQRTSDNLPIRLDIQSNSLAGLPWEFLFDPQEKTFTGFLSFGKETPVIRFFDKTPRPPTYDPPLRLLFFSANPPESEQLNLQKEFGVIQQSLKMLGAKVKLDYLFGATADSLAERIRNFKPHVVHFMGHGNVDQLLFEDGTVISSDSLTINLCFERSVRLVVLNACQSGGVEDCGGAEARLGIARSLAQAGIPAVVAMQFSISDPAAIAFAKSFYTSLVEERPVDEAVTLARIAMKTTLQEGSMEWATPVLYLQMPHGRLFQDLLKPQEAAPEVETTPEPQVQEEEDYRLKRRQSLEKQLAIAYNNLNKLQERAANYGLDIPLSLSNEIDEVQTKIERIEAELTALKDEIRSPQPPKSKEAPPPPPPRPEDTRVKLEIYFEEGMKYFDAGDWEKATGFLQVAAEIDAGYRNINQLLKTTREKFQEQKEQRQRQHRLEILLGQAKQHFEAGRWREALDLLQVIQGDDSGFRSAEVNQMLKQSRENYEHALETDMRQLQLETLYQRAKEAETAENWARTIYVLEELEQQAPAEGYRDAVKSLQKARRQRSLSEAYAKGTAAIDQKRWDEAVANLGQVYAWDETFKEVTEKLKAARNEQNLDARYQEGLAFLQAGRWPEAIEALAAIPADDLCRREAPLARNYAQAQLHLQTQEWTQAVVLLQTLANAAYRDAGKQLHQAQQEKGWADALAQARIAFQTKQWQTVINALKSIIDSDAPAERRQEAQKLSALAQKEDLLAQLYADAQRYFKLENWREAIATLEKLNKINDHYNDAPILLQTARHKKERHDLYNQARGEANQGNWAEAIHKYEELMGQAPEGFLDAPKQLQDARRRLKLVEAYRAAEDALKQRQWEKVVVLLKDVDENYLETTPYLIIAKRQVKLKQLYDEGKKHLQVKNWSEAITALEELQPNLKPDEPWDKTYADTGDMLNQARREKELADTYQLAQDALENERWVEAIQALQKIHTIQPDYRQVSILLEKAKTEQNFQHAYLAGVEAHEAKNWEKAILHLSTALRYKTNHLEAGNLKAEAERQQAIEQALQEGRRYEAENKWGEAVNAYHRVIELNPAHVEAINKLSEVERQERLTSLIREADQFIQREDWLKAITALEKIAQIDCNYNHVDQKLAQAKHQHQLDEIYQQAQAELDKGRQTYERENLQNAVDLFGQLTGYKDTAQKLREAQTDLELLDDYLLAHRMSKAERWQEAADKFQEITTRRPNYRDTPTYLNEARLNQKDEQHWREADKLQRGERGEPSDKDLSEAIKKLEQILPNGSNAYVDKAKHRITEIQKLLDAHLKAYYEEMISHAEGSRWEEALESLRKICAVNAKFENAAQELKQKMHEAVVNYKQNKDFKNALKIYDLSQTIETIPHNSESQSS